MRGDSNELTCFKESFKATCRDMLRELSCSIKERDDRKIYIVPNLGFKVENQETTLYMFDYYTYDVFCGTPHDERVKMWANAISYEYFTGFQRDFCLLFSKSAKNVLYFAVGCINVHTNQPKIILCDRINNLKSGF
jgi:hypothetical protein